MLNFSIAVSSCDFSRDIFTENFHNPFNSFFVIAYIPTFMVGKLIVIYFLRIAFFRYLLIICIYTCQILIYTFFSAIQPCTKMIYFFIL